MADPYLYIDATGVIIPDTADLRTDVENEYRAAFGADLDVSQSTPQGVLISAETLARAEAVRNNADVANQINPNIAGGVFLDAIMALTGLARTPATRSVVTAQLTGVATTVVPAGVRAALTTGEVFESLTGVVLDGSGNGEVQFRAIDPGPIAVGANTLTVIVDGVLGWETVDNSAAGTTGTLTQSDTGARALRRNTLALQGTSLPEAITSALYATEGVTSLAFRENVTGTTATIDGISLVGHSVWVCVDGGSDNDVAMALLDSKSAGAAWNGSTSVSVTDPYSGQTYTVKFDRPTPKPVIAHVTVRANSSISDPTTVVQDAILAYAAGQLPGESGFGVGDSVSAFELAGAINVAAPGIYVQLLETSYASPVSWGTTELVIALDEKATISRSGITVVVV